MERHTRQRQAVLDAIDGAGRALTPAEILELAQGSVTTLNLSTIYRHLNALQQAARVAKVVLPGQAARFEAVCREAHDHGSDHGHHHARGAADAQPHHHHHFHCSACDRVYALHACPGSLQEMAPRGFVVQAHEITLRGLCEECAP